ncbi:MAG: hypothetical protein V5A47_01225 [Bacteroidales bacterium]|nr:hypothetical protein [Bacteroidales bacterium]MBS3776204.1 hypothetical protein [Bacteroidales bacterium]
MQSSGSDTLVPSVALVLQGPPLMKEEQAFEKAKSDTLNCCGSTCNKQ